jgi:hypothetical protein
MATVDAPGDAGYPNTAALSTAQTGSAASTNIADRRGSVGPGLVDDHDDGGRTPTCTYAIEGSVDASDWFAVAYADAGTPETVSVATFAVTTATTVRKILRPNHPWRYLRVTYSANTNVTNTASLAVF